MIRTAYKVVDPGGNECPGILKVTVDDPNGISWREAKKQLRQWYLGQAQSLRGLTEKSYFGDGHGVG